MNELQVPKRQVPVELRAVGGEPRRVTLFLSEFAPGRAGPERVSDVLARSETFFPALDHATGRMTFVNRANVASARVPRLVETDPDAVSPASCEVEVALVDREVVRGVLSYVLASDRGRTIDHLNDAAPFFRLIVTGDDVLLVNKQHVARVMLVQP